MNFWDTSALVPLFVQEKSTGPVADRYEKMPAILAAHHAVTECASAFCRLEREGKLSPVQLADILENLHEESRTWNRVQMSSSLERCAIRCLRIHPLRAMDALHLASALMITADNPRACVFHTLDVRLSEAAAKEGFPLGSF